MQYFDILLFAVITGFLLIRLHRVLGRRTGHESPPPEAPSNSDPQGQADSPVAAEIEAEAEMPEASETGPAGAQGQATGLAAVQAADPSFEPEHFLAGARQAFAMIVGAFAAGEREPLQRLLSASVYRSFEASITDRERDGNVMEVRDIKVVHASIESAWMENTHAAVRVEFESEKIEVIRDAAGAVVDGDPDIPGRANDLWTFSRDVSQGDPNWILIRTGE